MNDVANSPIISDAAAAENCVVFLLAGKHFGLPLTLVEGIAAPPPLAAVPHATPALLGAGNLAGQIVPIVDLAALLRQPCERRHYDGAGEILRLRTTEGPVGVWVDRVERLSAGAARSTANDLTRLAQDIDFAVVDPMAIIESGLQAPVIAPTDALIDGRPSTEDRSSEQRATPARLPQSAAGHDASVVIEASETTFALQQDVVLELLEQVPWSPLPSSPSPLLGVAMLRDTALPVFSLAALAGRPVSRHPASFARVSLGEGQLLLAFDRVTGLRSGETLQAKVFDAALMPDELQKIVLEFANLDAVVPPTPDELSHDRIEYLCFFLQGQQFALPVSAIEQVIEPPPLVRLPRAIDNDAELSNTAGAIELRGQIIPVTALDGRLGIVRNQDIASAAHIPAAYLIVRTDEGISGIAIDRIGDLLALSDGDIAPLAGEGGLIGGIAARDATQPLRIIAPEHLWRTR